ncbi:hypothetical protein PROFUN_03760 [Planoprotostelium fungivorum]|uniref:Uncharacterized protein n=1 Tax=Planoprotostelium fungivorum TaxID=1890364 RepID=A0A2P6NDQ1_9EUKA|nr:hypothetical protein PROFUN_03760 [Planoprotostelium fungivorum]
MTEAIAPQITSDRIENRDVAGFITSHLDQRVITAHGPRDRLIHTFVYTSEISAKITMWNIFINFMRPATIIAAILGFVGMSITILDAKADKEVTVCRPGWCSPNLDTHQSRPEVATLCLISGSVIIEGSHFFDIFVWLESEYIYYVRESHHPSTRLTESVYLGFVPGLFSHTVLNSVVKFLDSVIISAHRYRTRMFHRNFFGSRKM